MYVVREVLHCKPGKVRDMITKFNGLGAVMKSMGLKPFRPGKRPTAVESEAASCQVRVRPILRVGG